MSLSDYNRQLPLAFSPGSKYQPESSGGGAPSQLPLAFNRCDIYAFETYMSGTNKGVADCLLNTAKGHSDRNIYLWGEQGVGKSHLLQAVCNSAAQAERHCAYIPLTQLDDFMPEMFSSLEELSLVCLDDLDQVAGKDNWEIAVFNLFNRLKDVKTPLVMSASRSPRGSLIRLPDLKSRLSWDLTFRLQPLDEAMKISVLKRRAQARGFELTDRVVEYLIKRVNRDTHNLFLWLDRLDTHSLIAQRKLTVEFVKQILEENQ